MKNTFWNKKGSEMTAGDSMKFIIILLAVIYGITYAIMGSIMFWENICEFFKRLKGKILDKFHLRKRWYERDDEEELD